ncbi:hypothetical protein [Gymnodinialimonas sp. 57CJ19]|uniref:hypothetical protein n=1 Tax=Gymnodinialimonas sp. 57CJ19 TaxID=3138498 RepID=UPI0031345696
MTERVVFNGKMSLGIALFVSVIFGGIATFGVMILYVAAREGVFDLFFVAIAVVVVLLFWAVIGVLWSALGVWLIITPQYVRTVGAFGTHTYPAEGLRAGIFAKRLSTGQIGKANYKTHKGEQLWLRAAGQKPRMIAQGLADDAGIQRVMQTLQDLIGIPVQRLHPDATTLVIKPDFGPFDETLS